MTLLAVSTVGGVIGIGLQLWLEPWTSTIAIALGAIAGIAIAQAIGEGLLVGLCAGGAIALLVLGVRALASIVRTLQRPPTMASPRVWFWR